MEAVSKYGHFEMYLATFAETKTANTKLNFIVWQTQFLSSFVLRGRCTRKVNS